MRRLFFAVFLVVACATVAAADSIEKAGHAYGRGDYVQAERLYRSLAEQGDPKAQYFLSVMYANGQGVSQDNQEAVKWIRKAADQGHAGAQYRLGLMYADGKGVSQDNQEAVRWIRKAAEQGHAGAQLGLGLTYYTGRRGIPRDNIRAHMWFSIAASALSGYEGKRAMAHRDEIASQLTGLQIGKAQERARRCQQSKFKECD